MVTEGSIVLEAAHTSNESTLRLLKIFFIKFDIYYTAGSQVSCNTVC